MTRQTNRPMGKAGAGIRSLAVDRQRIPVGIGMTAPEPGLWGKSYLLTGKAGYSNGSVFRWLGRYRCSAQAGMTAES